MLAFSVSAKDAVPATGGQGLRKPLCFVENKGQLTDQDNKPRTDIQYTLSAGSMSLFIGNGQMHYQFKRVEEPGSAAARLSTYRMDVTLAGADPHAAVVAEEGQAYYENFFLSNCSEGVTAHSWNRITYKNVYPGIDWVLYIKNDQVEYDFNVHPGGRVSDIKLEYGGATSLKVAKGGNIVATTPMGEVQEKKPFAYDNTGKEVASCFKLKGNVVSFETGHYDGTLTIDPYLLWSTYLGGAAQDQSTGVVTDAGHNTYVSGFTASAGLATGFAYHNTYQGGVYDAFVAKYNVAGTIQFVTYFGGNATDQGTCVAVDNTGNIYLGGSTNSAAGISSGGAYHPAINGGTDGFIAKFNSTGSFRLWGTYYGGAANDVISGMAIDGAGNIYVTGQTASAALVASAGAYQGALNGPTDAFIAKFNNAGTNQWSTYYGGTAQEQGLGIACDAAGNVYVTGQTNSVTNMVSAGAYQSALSGTNDAFIAKFTTGGVRTWGTYFGGPGADQGNGIAFDNSTGNIAIVGNTNSTSNLASANSFQPAFGGIQDAFVAYFQSTGGFVWASYYGGTMIDYGQGICFDALGDVYIVGATFSTTGIATTNSFQPAGGGDYDAFIAKLNSLGQPVWNSYFGGIFYDNATAVTCDANNQLVVAGYTSSFGNYGSGGLATAGSAQAVFGGITDGFVTRFKTDTTVAINQPYTDTLVCAGSNLDVFYSVFAPGVTFQPGNTFTLQLSDAFGSFAAPVAIGSVTSNSSGLITATIPAVTVPGNRYRIRIVASNPSFISPDDYLNIKVVTSITDTTAQSNSPVCVGGDIHLYDNPPYSVTSYNWTGPLGFGSGVQNPVITGVALANAGVYKVTTTHNGCPSVVDSVSVIINSVIPPTPTSDPASSVCAGSTISLHAYPGAVSGVTYHWSGPSSFSSTLQNPTIAGAAAGNSGIYKLQDTLGGCPSAFGYDTVTVIPVVPASITITANAPYRIGAPGDTICGGAMVSFTAFPVNGGSSPHYQWMTGPSSPVVGAISGTWASPTLTDGEVVYCELISSINCPSPAIALSNGIKMNVITNAPQVYISAYPGIHVPAGDSIRFTSTVYNGGIAPLYQWTKNNVPIPGATNSTYTLLSVTAADTISLVVTSTMLCAVPNTGISNVLIANTNVGVANISALFGGVQLYPNPNNGTFTLNGTLESSNPAVILEVTNMLGQTIYSRLLTVQNHELNEAVSLQNIPSGIYFLRLSQDGASKAFRFPVQR